MRFITLNEFYVVSAMTYILLNIYILVICIKQTIVRIKNPNNTSNFLVISSGLMIAVFSMVLCPTILGFRIVKEIFSKE